MSPTCCSWRTSTWIGCATRIDGPADLAVEVVSPNDRPAEIAEKVAFYLEHGVPLVWVAYPRPRHVVVHRPGQPPRTFGADDTLDGEEIVPGFRLPVAEVFR